MRKVVLLVGALLGFAVGFACAAEVDLAFDLMQSIEDTNKSLSSNISLKNAEAATANANELIQSFTQVETFFVQKGGAENAVELATKSKTLSGDIVKAVAANDFDTATNLATDLSRACRSCHTFYKKE